MWPDFLCQLDLSLSALCLKPCEQGRQLKRIHWVSNIGTALKFLEGRKVSARSRRDVWRQNSLTLNKCRKRKCIIQLYSGISTKTFFNVFTQICIVLYLSIYFISMTAIRQRMSWKEFSDFHPNHRLFMLWHPSVDCFYRHLKREMFESPWTHCSHPVPKCCLFCPLFSKVANRKGTSWLHNPSLNPSALWSPRPTLSCFPRGRRLTLLWSVSSVTCAFSQCTEDPRSVASQCLVWPHAVCTPFIWCMVCSRQCLGTAALRL